MQHRDCLIESSTLVRYVGKDASVSIPKGITIIGQDAFKDCCFLEQVHLSDGVIEIRQGAFCCCTALSAVVIPDSVLHIDEQAFDTSASPRLLFLCADHSAASQFADTHKIARRVFSPKILERLKKAQKEREQLTVRTFQIASQSIVCSNDMVKRAAVHTHYNSLATPFYEKFQKNIPEKVMETDPYNHICEDTEALLTTAVQFLEEQGVYASVAWFSDVILSVYQNVLSIIKNAYSYRAKLSGAADAYLNTSRAQLMEEAEHKVTGLGYGIITNSPLLLATYALDNLLTQQRQREEARKEALSQMPTHIAHAAMEIVMQYDAYRKEQALPELRKTIEQLTELLKETTLRLLQEHELLLSQATPTYPQQAEQVLQMAQELDAEKLALALKLNPISVNAYRAAIKRRLLTKELVEMMLFTGLNDTRVMHQVLQSPSISETMLSELYESVRNTDSVGAQLCGDVLQQMADATEPAVAQQPVEVVDSKKNEQRDLVRQLQAQLEQNAAKDYRAAYRLVLPYCDQLQPHHLRELLRSATEEVKVQIQQKVDAVVFSPVPTDAEYQTLAQGVLSDVLEPTYWGLHYLCVAPQSIAKNDADAAELMLAIVAETIFKECIYRQACTMLDNARTKEDFVAAGAMFDKLKTIRGGYKDSNHKKMECFMQRDRIVTHELQRTTGGKSSSGGCYVATAVYGSYDCPQVWRLRRFRDLVLAKYWLGRCFIRTYYATSPTLVKWLGKTLWFNKICRALLDKLIARLTEKGFSEAPYQDP